MKILIVVDANIILSALLGGKPSIILFDRRFKFVTTEFTLMEVQKYFPKLQEKLRVSKDNLNSLLNSLPIKVYSRRFYQEKFKNAQKVIEKIDRKDVELLALALKMGAIIWSQDRYFEDANYSLLLRTEDFF